MLEQGEISELKFALACREHGFIVSKPMSTTRYDLVVDVGGKLHRVQVKSASKQKSRERCRSLGYPVMLRQGRGEMKCYQEHEIDFFAIHLRNDDLWYIVPVKYLINKASLHINPDRKPNVGGTRPMLDWAQFREAWNLLA